MKHTCRCCLAIAAVVTALLCERQAWAEPKPMENDLESFLGEARFDTERLQKGGRFPNVAVALDGAVLAAWNGVTVRRSEDGGQTWGPNILIGKGFMGGGLTVNETNGDIFAFVEESHPPAPLTVYRSQDHGKTWMAVDVQIKPDSSGNVPSMHMNEHGVTLRHGKHAGRIIRPTRYYAGRNASSLWPKHYTNAIYSDDNGETWQTSEPFPEFGTGEATLAELSDGRIYYNTRRHWAPEGKNPRRRWTAISEDGGATWKDSSICEVLPDGPQDRDYGCMAGLVRLPVKGKDILLYSNCDSPGGRKLGTVWASFDGGKTWPLKRLVTEGSFAYSSMNAGRPGTKSEGWIYLNYEAGGSQMARFNLAWLLDVSDGKAQLTGNGTLPEWAQR